MPLLIGTIVGISFGGYDLFVNPQKTYYTPLVKVDADVGTVEKVELKVEEKEVK